MIDDLHGILANGDPDAIQGQSDELLLIADNIDTTRRQLRDITVFGAWDSEAGETFEDRIGSLPNDLEAVSDRFRETAEILTPYARELRRAQEELRGLQRSHSEGSEEYDRVRAQMEARDPGDPERESLSRRVDEIDASLDRTEQLFTRVSEGILEREERVGAGLDRLADLWGDSWVYDLFEGSSRLGDIGQAQPLPVLPWWPFSGLPGDLGRRAFYDEGSYKELATVYAGRSVDLAGKPLRKGIKVLSGLPVLNNSKLLKSTNARITPKTTRFYTPRHAKPVNTNPVATTRWGRGQQWSRKQAGKVRDKVATKVKKDSGYTAARESLQDWESVVGTNKVAEWAAVATGTTRVGRQVHKSATSYPDKVEKVVNPEERAAEKRRDQREKQRVDERRREGADEASSRDWGPEDAAKPGGVPVP